VMLQRVSDDGSYNQDFVNEFRVFTAELRDFFNAGSFADMLEGLKGALDDQEHQVRTLLLLIPGHPFHTFLFQNFKHSNRSQGVLESWGEKQCTPHYSAAFTGVGCRC